jgi:hypothetical protein
MLNGVPVLLDQSRLRTTERTGIRQLTATAGNIESRVLSALWQQAAREYGEVKFCEIRGSPAIEGEGWCG